MLFRFSSQLEINEIFDLQFVGCYALATLILYIVVIFISSLSGNKFETSVFDGKYICGSVTKDYLTSLESERKDSSKIG